MALNDPKGIPLDFNEPLVTPSPIRSLADIPDLLTMTIRPIEYLVDGLIARGTITLWTGPDGAAKTFLTQKMAIAVATGGQFLGRRCRRCGTLILDYENPAFAVRERLELMAGGPIDGLKIWGTWLEQQPPQIGNELLLSIAKDSKPLIIVDPFRYSHGAEENDSTAMMGVMQMLRYCAAAGGAVVVLHHPAKTEHSTGRGSSAIKGAADVAFLQEMSDESGLITLACTKNRFGEKHALTIRPDYETGNFEVTDSPQFTKRTTELENLRKIIAENPGLTQNALRGKSGMRKGRLSELLRAGESDLWEERKQGYSKLYFPLFPNREQVGNSGTGLGVSKVVPLFPPLGGGTGNRSTVKIEPVPETEKTGNSPPKTSPDPVEEKSLPSCPTCGGSYLVREQDGSTTCMTCETKIN
jgi:hypothetical protein